ncbi:SDR family oxidoreductase [Fluviicola chungangensis]|uniref:NAD-dependent dehydratase n=1 Tax=Fluviicola chungangensis TaxID=2597671 RepID=A0A556N351_9FLAO|nr:NAD(P)H-binding protein [Fluviicola chungangensis]TSJ46626.1 NAD-dependent dehydratase [Fluviicola chungangensis]
MNIVLTGSLGNISKPLAQELIAKGHSVTVISSNSQKEKDIHALGATAAIGKLEDRSFLTKTFTGAEAVYCMIPMNLSETNFQNYMHNTANNYVQAIKQAGIKRVVILSGWSADLIKGENIEHLFIEQLDASITIMRPGAFYTNFYFSMDLIKGKGFIGKYLTLRYSGLMALFKGRTGLLMGNYGGEDKIVFVSPKDIATAVAEELIELPVEQLKIRYVGSEELTCNEAAKIIGTAIGKPWLRWVRISDKQMLQGLKMAKMPQELAETMVEMQSVMHSGKPLQNFHRNNPKMGKVKLADFAKEFAAVYNQK